MIASTEEPIIIRAGEEKVRVDTYLALADKVEEKGLEEFYVEIKYVNGEVADDTNTRYSQMRVEIEDIEIPSDAEPFLVLECLDDDCTVREGHPPAGVVEPVNNVTIATLRLKLVYTDAAGNYHSYPAPSDFAAWVRIEPSVTSTVQKAKADEDYVPLGPTTIHFREGRSKGEKLIEVKIVSDRTYEAWPGTRHPRKEHFLMEAGGYGLGTAMADSRFKVVYILDDDPKPAAEPEACEAINKIFDPALVSNVFTESATLALKEAALLNQEAKQLKLRREIISKAKVTANTWCANAIGGVMPTSCPDNASCVPVDDSQTECDVSLKRVSNWRVHPLFTKTMAVDIKAECRSCTLECVPRNG